MNDIVFIILLVLAGVLAFALTIYVINLVRKGRGGSAPQKEKKPGNLPDDCLLYTSLQDQLHAFFLQILQPLFAGGGLAHNAGQLFGLAVGHHAGHAELGRIDAQVDLLDVYKRQG